METWAIVTLVLGTSAVSALLTFFITKMQVRHSDKRLEKELERAREVDDRQRRREVESEPLLKLRNELARMATKRDRLLASAHKGHAPLEMTKEEATREKQEAENDWNAYLVSGDLPQILFLQYDTELVNKVEEIRRDYWDWVSVIKGAGKIRKENKARVIEVQSLINKLLKEL